MHLRLDLSAGSHRCESILGRFGGPLRTGFPRRFVDGGHGGLGSGGAPAGRNEGIVHHDPQNCCATNRRRSRDRSQIAATLSRAMMATSRKVIVNTIGRAA